MASRKPSRRRTHLSFERLDDRITPATFLPSASIGSNFIIPNLGSASFFNTGSTLGLTGTNTGLTLATGANPGTATSSTIGFSNFGQPSASVSFPAQQSATANFTGIPAGAAAGNNSFFNLAPTLGFTQAFLLRPNPAAVGSNPLPQSGFTVATLPNALNAPQFGTSTLTTGTLTNGSNITPAFTTAFLGGGNSLLGNSGLSFLGNTGLTTPGSGLGLGGLTNSGLSLASGLGAFPSTFLTSLPMNLTPTIPSTTTSSLLPVAGSVAQALPTLSAFGASTRPAGSFLTGLSPMIQATTAAQGALRSVTPASIVTPVAAPTTTVTTATTPFQTTATLSNTVPLTVTPTIGNVAAVTAALASMGVTPQRIAPFTNAISFNAPLSFLPQVATL